MHEDWLTFMICDRTVTKAKPTLDVLFNMKNINFQKDLIKLLNFLARNDKTMVALTLFI